MKGIVIIVAGTTLGIALAVTPLAWNSGPAITITDRRIDLGIVAPGSTVTREVMIENSGGGVLEINAIRTSCGCTVATLPETRLSGGQRVPIQLTFNSSHASVSQSTVLIQSNDRNKPVVSISVSSKRGTLPSLSRQSAYLTDRCRSAILFISSIGRSAYGQDDVFIDMPRLCLFSVSSTPEPQDHRYAVVVSLSDSSPTGVYSRRIGIRMRDGTLSERFTATSHIPSDLLHVPPEPSLSMRQLRSKLRIDHKSGTNGQFRLVTCRCDGPVSCRILEQKDGATWIDLELQSDSPESDEMDRQSTCNLLVTARKSDGSSETFSVPVRIGQ
jgi:hypothetical protein